MVRLALGRETLADLFDRLALAFGDHTFATFEEDQLGVAAGARTLSFAGAADAVARIAAVLFDEGVRAGSRVAVCTASRVDYALTLFAVVRLGAVGVPLHHHLKRGEVASMLARSKAKLLVADPAVAADVAGVKVVVTGRALAAKVAAARPRKALRIAADAPALILFTSGTTGSPKGATLTSKSLLAVARLASLARGIVADRERGISGLPLAHVMGLSTLLCAAMAGVAMHWLAKFDPAVVLARIEEQRPSFFVGVPAMYAMLASVLEAGGARDLSSIRLFASGADAMPPALVDKFRKLGCAQTIPGSGDAPLLTAAFAEIYGMVELSGPAIIKLTLPEPVAGLRAAKARAALGRLASRVRTAVRGPARDDAGGGAVGIPIPPYRARVVDNDGREVKPGVVGELVLKGPGVLRGYDGDKEATARSTRGGWLYTGDLAKKSRAGLIAFVTRKKDVIKHGGFSVFPAEVEAQLMEHPAIAEAVVVGVPHAKKGAVPAAVVVLKGNRRASEDELLAWCKEEIAPFKAPRAVIVVGAGEIPRNANKKVLKDALRDALLPRLTAALR